MGEDSLNLRKIIRIYSELSKTRITIAVTLTCAIGFILAKGSLTIDVILPIIGTFILACGSAALNQYQEYEFDILMNRTEKRPIPAKLISPNHALIFSLVLIIIGVYLLFVLGSDTMGVLGLSALILYNVVYTPMKRLSTLAVFPGAIIGAIPPIIGWVAGGESVLDMRILALGFFIFIWQIPHFWLLVLIYDEQYKKAGYPVLTDNMTDFQLRRITFIWILALAASCMIFPLFKLSNYFITNILFLIFGAFLVWKSKALLNLEFDKKIIRQSFIRVNIYVLMVLFTLIFDRLI